MAKYQQTPPSGNDIAGSAIFKKFLSAAEGYIKQPTRLKSLLTDAYKKASEKNDVGTLAHEAWDTLQTIFRLVRSSVSGEYTGLPTSTMLAAVAVLIYFLSPIDLIPDFIPVLGLLDDVALVAWFSTTLKHEIDKFHEWETTRPSEVVASASASSAGSTGSAMGSNTYSSSSASPSSAPTTASNSATGGATSSGAPAGAAGSNPAPAAAPATFTAEAAAAAANPAPNVVNPAAAEADALTQAPLAEPSHSNDPAASTPQVAEESAKHAGTHSVAANTTASSREPGTTATDTGGNVR